MIRMTITIAWCAFLLVCTCTRNLEHMVIHGDIQFRLDKHPAWHQLFNLPSEDIAHIHLKWYLIQKAGHFAGFALLSVMLFKHKHTGIGILLAIGYALLTEILQMYFSRDGRIVDVCIDSAGIIIACLFLNFYRSKRAVSHTS